MQPLLQPLLDIHKLVEVFGSKRLHEIAAQGNMPVIATLKQEASGNFLGQGPTCYKVQPLRLAREAQPESMTTGKARV